MARANFDSFKATNYSKHSDGDAFERFAVGQVTLRRQNLSASELESGIVGASNDGGIDGFFVFINGSELVAGDSIRLTRRAKALDGLQLGFTIDIIVVQAKAETAWDTNVMPKIESALKAVLAANATSKSLRAFPLNDDMVEKALDLQLLLRKTSMLAPRINVVVEYVTFANQATVDSYMRTKRDQLKSTLQDILPSGSSVNVHYVGDAEIVSQVRISHDFTTRLDFAKAPARLDPGFVGLVKLKDYLRFLRKEGDVLREELFAFNVRDFAGEGTGVNSAITRTLSADSATEFWWLNNGITIICDEARETIELKWLLTNPLIVNGLQTSNVLHAAASRAAITKRRLAETVLVRVIQESNPVVREAIIAGTNNQTAIASIQLHANEEKQIRIEDYLRTQKWYYERRRYQYRGAGLPASRIRTVTELAQAVMSYRLLEPDTARARPSSLLTNPSGWSRVFVESESEELYHKALNVAEIVDQYLATSAAKAIADDATNSRQYLVAGYALRASGVKQFDDFERIPSSALKANPGRVGLQELHAILHSEVNRLDDGKIARDKIFKGNKLKGAFFQQILVLNAT